MVRTRRLELLPFKVYLSCNYFNNLYKHLVVFLRLTEFLVITRMYISVFQNIGQFVRQVWVFSKVH